MRSMWVILCPVLGLIALLSVASAQSFNCVFTWNPVTTHVDGTPATVDGYRLYRKPGANPFVKGQFTYDVPVIQLADLLKPEVVNVCQVGEVWTATAYYTDVNAVLKESAFSNIYTVTQVLQRPVVFRIRTQSVRE